MFLKKRLKQGRMREKDWGKVLRSCRLSVQKLAALYPAAPDHVLLALAYKKEHRPDAEEEFPFEGDFYSHDHFSEVSDIIFERPLTPELQITFFKHFRDVVSCSTAPKKFFSNPNLDPELLKRLILEPMPRNPRYRRGVSNNVWAVAESPLVKKGLAETLLTLSCYDSDFEISKALASNPDTPSETLTKMLDKFGPSRAQGAGGLRTMIMSNPNTSPEVYGSWRFDGIPEAARDKILVGLTPRLRIRALEVGKGGTVNDVLKAVGKTSLPAQSRWDRRVKASTSPLSELRRRFDDVDKDLGPLIETLPQDMRKQTEEVLADFDTAFEAQLDLYQKLSGLKTASASTLQAKDDAYAEAARLITEYEKLSEALVALTSLSKGDTHERLEETRFKVEAYRQLLEA